MKDLMNRLMDGIVALLKDIEETLKKIVEIFVKEEFPVEDTTAAAE